MWPRSVTRDLRRVQSVGNSEVLRLWSKRNTDIGRQRSRVVSRLYALLVELARDDVVDLLMTNGWRRIGSGVEGTLWRAADDSATVAVPDRLTPESYE